MLIKSQRDETNTATKDEIVNRIGRKAWIHLAELSDRQAVKAIIPTLASQGLKPNILVTCAGIQRRHPSHQFPDEDWDEVSETEHFPRRVEGCAPDEPPVLIVLILNTRIGPGSESFVCVCTLP